MIHTINSNKIIRVAVCLLVICCLIVNMSPIRAEATTAASALSVVAVPAINAIGAILRCLGIGPSADTSAFDNLVNTIIDSLFLGEVLELVTWAVGGFQKYAVPENIIDSVFSYIYSASVVNESLARTCTIPAGTVITEYSGTYVRAERTILQDCYGFLVYANSTKDSYADLVLIPYDYSTPDSVYALGYPGYSNLVDAPVYFAIIDVKVSTLPFSMNSVVSTGIAGPVRNFLNGTLEFSPARVISTDYDLVLESVCTSEQTVDEVYAISGSSALKVYKYSDGSLNEEPEDSDTEQVPVPYWPLSIQQTYEETISQTQEEAQSGESTYVDPDSATVGDIFSKLVALPSNIADAFSNVITGVTSLVDFFTGTTVVASPMEAIDFSELFELFPFNIPYDIYQTINFWSSSAESPTIVIPLPNYDSNGLGIYEYEINFSKIPGMDTLAAILRGGELILFAIGLVMITRKVTKW